MTPKSINYTRVLAVAARLSPLHLEELLLLKLASLRPETQLANFYRANKVAIDLVRWKVLTARYSVSWPRDYRMLRVTELGERVLLARAREAFLSTGAIVEEDEV